jgi:hypothetical protein
MYGVPWALLPGRGVSCIDTLDPILVEGNVAAVPYWLLP